MNIIDIVVHHNETTNIDNVLLGQLIVDKNLSQTDYRLENAHLHKIHNSILDL